MILPVSHAGRQLVLEVTQSVFGGSPPLGMMRRRRVEVAAELLELGRHDLWSPWPVGARPH